MSKILIEKTPNADTRSMEKIDYDLIYEDTKKHINAVKNVMEELANVIKLKGIQHDWTKLVYFDMFFNDLSTKKTGAEFKSLEWWKLHLKERHHINDKCYSDVNLIDVLEMVVDCVCAGKARTGNVYPIELSNDILQKALTNTTQMLMEMIEVKE